MRKSHDTMPKGDIMMSMKFGTNHSLVSCKSSSNCSLIISHSFQDKQTFVSFKQNSLKSRFLLSHLLPINFFFFSVNSTRALQARKTSGHHITRDTECMLSFSPHIQPSGKYSSFHVENEKSISFGKKCFKKD